MTTLKPKFKKRWLKALRSGEYPQTENALVEMWGGKPVGYCCLGVACAVSSEKYVQGVEKFFAPVGTDPDHWENLALPSAVMSAYGFESSVGDYNISDLPPEVEQKIKQALLDAGPGSKYVHGMNLNNHNSLALLNDAGVPFHVIADVVEALF